MYLDLLTHLDSATTSSSPLAYTTSKDQNQYASDVSFDNLTVESSNTHYHHTNHSYTRLHLNANMLILDELQQLMSGGPSAAGAGDENNTHNLVRLVRSAATFTRNTDLWFINLLASHRYIITAGKARHASRYKMSFIKRIQITHEEAVNSIRSDSKELLKEFVNNLSSGKKTILYFKVPNVNWIAVLFSLQKFDKLASAKKKTITAIPIYG
jgi:hypothetical protein